MEAEGTRRHIDETMPVFRRVVCGVAGREAVQVAAVAARLTDDAGSLMLLHVADLAADVEAPWQPDAAARDSDAGAHEVLLRASEAASSRRRTASHMLYGHAALRLLAELKTLDPTLVVVGGAPRSRAAGIAVGSVATRLVHDAPCSVLLLRRVGDPSVFPTSIAVGDDGSPESLRAAAVAHALAERFGASLRRIVATGGKPVHIEVLHTKHASELEERRPVDALVRASSAVDLLVVGSRGLHGLAALGSVSERVAHHAWCSVLVVR